MNNFVKKYFSEPIRESIVILIIKVFLIMFLFSTAFFVIELFSLKLDLPESYHNTVTVFLFFGHVLKSFLEIYFVINIIMKWLGNTYYFNIENRELIKSEGLLSVREKTYDLKNLRSIELEQNLVGKLFHYGNITISTSASGGYNDKIYLKGIPNPEKNIEMFEACLTKVN